MLTSIPGELLDFINKYRTFFVIGHKEPDGDCLGSQKALASMLNRSGRKAVLCSEGPFIRPETMAIEHLFTKSIKKAVETYSIPADEAAVIIVDCSTPERIGESLADEIKGFPTAVIDHHASGKSFGDVKWINGGSPSTTVMIYQLFKQLKVKPNAEEAEDMMFGFITDTGYFRHLDRSNSKSTQLMSELLSFDISLKELYYRMYGGRELESKILTGRILSRAEPIFNGRCILIYETLDEKKRFGSKNRDSDTIYSQLLTVKNCEAVIFIREEEEAKCSVSLRSLDEIDVGRIAASFGGGGHKRAAGIEWSGSREEITKRLKSVFQEIFE